MTRSIAYDPRTCTKKGFFLGPVLAPRGGPKVQCMSLYFIRKLILLLFMEGYETDVEFRGKGSKVGVTKNGRGQKGRD